MQIGIIGGTYNPPHIGHIHAARAAKAELGLDMVLFLPASIPPHKQLPEKTPDVTARLEMTRLAAIDADAQVCDIEIRRGGISYTADTLLLLKRKYPDAKLWLIIGSDMFFTIQNWRRPETIFKTAGIAVVPRTDGDLSKLSAHAGILRKRFDCTIKIIKTETVPVSSTELRENIESSKSREYIPAAVYQYICEHGLYKADSK